MSALYAQVIVEIEAAAVDRLFVYRSDLPLSVGDRVLVPFGPRRVEGYVLSLSDRTDFPQQRIRDVIRKLDDVPAILPELVELAWWMKEKTHCLMVDALRQMIPAQLRGGRVRPLMRRFVLLPDPQAARETLIALQKRAPKQAQVLQVLLETGGMPLAGLEARCSGAAAAVAALEKKGLLKTEQRRVLRSPIDRGASGGALLPPTAQQQIVIDECLHALRNGGGRFLLHGVTGSGKTEVYCHLIRQALLMGKGAIVLVPEIALTPQMVAWFTARFGATAAVLHSRLSAGERFDEWQRIRLGQARVVVGARSAVFAPVEDLGVLVVDEEHESTYLSEKTPRYDAREVAVWRCERAGALCLLGSATPQIKTYHNALRGYYTLLELRERVNRRPMPQVQVVDMRRELVLGNKSIFSGALVHALRDCFARGEQAMLFINRRGYNTFVSCRSCGKTVKCPQCDVSLTYHAQGERLRCHYCGFEMPPPTQCPACGSSLIRYFGTGTERVSGEIARLFPNVNAVRMDADTTSGKNGHERVLAQFRSGKAQLMVGTQMIAKGHDFPKVTVVGVIAGDMLLSMPDYRSAERTFALLTQMAGRAGRGDLPGQVFFQTYDPEHYAVRAAAAQDYRAFYNEEIQRRRRGLYPPYTVHARLLFSAQEEALCCQAAQESETLLRDWISAHPNERKTLLHMRALKAPIGYIRGQYRWQLFVKLHAKAPQAILDYLEQLSQTPRSGVTTDFEINPNSML